MVGKVTTEGDRAMRSDIARQQFGVDGTGIKISVISDSYDVLKSANENVINGDLPGVGNPNEYNNPVRVLKESSDSNPKDEGRAMLQIVHDVAPGSELLFHTGENEDGNITDKSIADAITALSDAGADVIVDDVSSATTFFQDGIAAKTVDEVAKQGVTYLSAAGNDGDLSYESVFQPTETTFSFNGETYVTHDFDVGVGIDLFQDIQISKGSNLDLLLNWSEASGQISSDYEMFLVDRPELPSDGALKIDSEPAIELPGGGKILSLSIDPSNPQLANLDANQLAEIAADPARLASALKPIKDPVEALTYPISLGEDNDEPNVSEDRNLYLVIGKKQDSANNATDSSSDLIKWIDTTNQSKDNKYEYVNDRDSLTGGSTVYGQANAEGAIAVGAANYEKTPEFGVSPTITEDFSSSGSVPILFDAEGNPLASPEVRQKPEIIAPNGGATALEEFERFFGTSAAAPHAAAVTALMLQRAGGRGEISPEQIRNILKETSSTVQPKGNLPSETSFIRADAAVAGVDELTGINTASNLVGGNDSNVRSQTNAIESQPSTLIEPNWLLTGNFQSSQNNTDWSNFDLNSSSTQQQSDPFTRSSNGQSISLGETETNLINATDRSFPA
jgi:hypothetical protein